MRGDQVYVRKCASRTTRASLALTLFLPGVVTLSVIAHLERRRALLERSGMALSIRRREVAYVPEDMASKLLACYLRSGLDHLACSSIAAMGRPWRQRRS